MNALKRSTFLTSGEERKGSQRTEVDVPLQILTNNGGKRKEATLHPRGKAALLTIRKA